ncbi:hypothetical protein E2C01_024630 [Portunus trituberculatus]|uniref:Uncharacterized protein n=1 Tax=Portunus trituberculatus TaxID=210409 RepID=A0A5B7EFB7_PORTR|nr:hypothetical protein [Portunus trituberculatus]
MSLQHRLDELAATSHKVAQNAGQSNTSDSLGSIRHTVIIKGTSPPHLSSDEDRHVLYVLSDSFAATLMVPSDDWGVAVLVCEGWKQRVIATVMY